MKVIWGKLYPNHYSNIENSPCYKNWNTPFQYYLERGRVDFKLLIMFSSSNSSSSNNLCFLLWMTKFVLRVNDALQDLQEKSFFPVSILSCSFMWFFKDCFKVNCFAQISQENGCIFLCDFSWPFVGNNLSQISQGKVISSAWIFECFANSDLVAKHSTQESHRNSFSLVCFFLCKFSL